MSTDPTQTGLSVVEARELRELEATYQQAIGYNIAQPSVWFGNHITSYLSSLAIDTTLYLGHAPSAEDIINELARVVTVPTHIADAIHRDVDRLRA